MRGCGKTSTGLEHAHSSLRLDSPPQLIELASLNPTDLLKGDAPRLIDEWQLAPTLWNVIRHEIDDRQRRGQFEVPAAHQLEAPSRRSRPGVRRTRHRSERLAADPEFFGQVFVAMVIRDIRALSSAEQGRVYHYRDSTGLIADAERNLLTLRDHRVDLDRVGKPAFLAIVTGTQYAYTLPTGVRDCRRNGVNGSTARLGRKGRDDRDTGGCGAIAG